MAQPLEIRLLRTERRLEVAFDDGARFAYTAEYLRVESPSAEVQGHHPGQRRFLPRCPTVGIVAIEKVGRYAVRLVFDDGHDTGIYAWAYLYELGRDHQARWAAYLLGLAEGRQT